GARQSPLARTASGIYSEPTNQAAGYGLLHQDWANRTRECTYDAGIFLACATRSCTANRSWTPPGRAQTSPAADLDPTIEHLIDTFRGPTYVQSPVMTILAIIAATPMARPSAILTLLTVTPARTVKSGPAYERNTAWRLLFRIVRSMMAAQLAAS